MSGQEPEPIPGQPPAPLPVKFVHKWGNAFHGVHADGVWGLLNGHGVIQLNFFTERPPIPDTVIFAFKPDGSFAQPVEEHSEKDEKNFLVIREFQVGVSLALAEAKQVHAVLGNFIAMAEDSLRLAEQMKAKTTKTL